MLSVVFRLAITMLCPSAEFPDTICIYYANIMLRCYRGATGLPAKTELILLSSLLLNGRLYINALSMHGLPTNPQLATRVLYASHPLFTLFPTPSSGRTKTPSKVLHCCVEFRCVDQVSKKLFLVHQLHSTAASGHYWLFLDTEFASGSSDFRHV